MVIRINPVTSGHHTSLRVSRVKLSTNSAGCASGAFFKTLSVGGGLEMRYKAWVDRNLTRTAIFQII